MKLSASVFVVAVFVVSACAQSPDSADAIYFGGPIVTMNDEQSTAEAVAVKDGVILAVGSLAEIERQHKGAKTELRDLNGKTMTPSFIDAHGHFMNSLNTQRWANVSAPPVGDGANIEEILKTLLNYKTENNVSEGEWIIAYGYDESLIEEGRHMTAEEIDAVLPEHRVMVIHSSNHGAVLNAGALEHYKIDASTETPAGGVIARKQGSNEPAGLLMETAFMPIFADLPQPSEEENLDLLKSAQEMYASNGFTTVQEGATHSSELAFLRKGAAQGRLFLDVVSLPIFTELHLSFPEDVSLEGTTQLTVEDGIVDHFGTYKNRLKLGGVKLMTDGSNQGKTGYWSEPLLTPGPLGQDNWRGEPIIPPDAYNYLVKKLADRGVQLWTHANADAAIDMVIDGARAAGLTSEQDHRSIVIHSQIMRPDQLDTYVELGLSPSFFSVHAFYWGDVHIRNLGFERAAFLSPMASAKAKGLRFSNHNDFMVTPVDAMMMMWTATNRTTRTGVVLGENERVDAETALRALTIDAAWQYREDDSKGSIEPGKRADLAILSENPLDVDVADIRNIAVIETIKDGEVVFRKSVR